MIDGLGIQASKASLIPTYFEPRTCVKYGLVLLLLVTTSTFALGADEKQNANKCRIEADYAVRLNGDAGTDMAAMSEYSNTIRQMLREEKFSQLDCIADGLRSNKERFLGGTWKLHILYEGLQFPVEYPQHATEDDWKVLLDHLQRWVTTHPDSVTGRVALASAYINYAWDARGNGFVDTISANGQKLYEQRTAEAERVLTEAVALPTRCPEWYLAMLRVAENQGRTVDEVRLIFERASKFEPGYYYYARVFGIYLLPRWSGEPGDAEKFSQQLADGIGGDDGDILYFQIASTLIRGCSCGDDPQMSWSRIKKGFEATEKRYGSSMLNLNLIAFLASNYADGDPVMAKRVMTRIGAQWDRETWKKREAFEWARNWAEENASRAAKIDEMESAAKANMQAPEGPQYKAAFEKTYKEFVQQCLRSEGGSSDKFETLTNVGAKGSIEEINIYWNGPAAVCVYQKLHTLQQQKATPFPVPPQAPYWVRLDLDAGALGSVAAQ